MEIGLGAITRLSMAWSIQPNYGNAMTLALFHAAVPRAAAVLAAALVTITPRAGLAADASPWASSSHAAVRLIAGAPTRQGGTPVLRAGIAFKLERGWKTYWRYPGDAGVPPRFDFGGSLNLADARVLWPAPHRFEDAGQFSIGYTEDFVMPLRITPRDAAAPVRLRLKLDYAICANICVPVDAVLELELDPGQTETTHEEALRASEARVPQPAAVGAEGPLAVLAVQQEKAAKSRVVVTVAAADTAALDLFAEGPHSDWSLPLPAPLEALPDGRRRFAFEIDGVPPGATAQGARVRLTLVSRAGAIEVPITLD